MRILGQRFEIADAVVAGTGSEDVAKCERAERRVAAGAAAAYGQPIAVNFAALREIARALDAVIDIDDAPASVQPFSIGAAVARAAAVVDVEDGDAAAGPILDRIFERRRARRSRAAVDDDEQRLLFIQWRGVIAVFWRIEIRVRGQTVGGSEFDGARIWK